jgi:hypothetical protein
MSVFSMWMKALGFHGKQVSQAAGLIGINNPNTAGQTYRGEREMTTSELLAMSAIRAGLEPWSPENDSDAVLVRAVLDMARRASASKPVVVQLPDSQDARRPRRANA